MIIHCRYDELAGVHALKPHPKNRNRHPEDQIDRLAKILAYQGIRAPIVVSKRSGFIVKGHGTLAAIQKNGWTQAPVVYQDFENDEQEYAFVQSDNAVAAWAELDLSGINADIGDLGPDFDIDLLGIKDFVLEPVDKLPPGCDEDEVPEPKESIAKRGDIWQLGRHRLMCGDSTSIDDVERLMGGEKADMCFTSPPYNLGKNAKLRGYNGDGKDSAYIEKSDHKTDSEYLDFLIAFTNNALIAADTCFVNIQLLAGNKFVLPEYWRTYAQRTIDVFVWDKEHAQPSAAARVLNSVWEFIFIFGNEDRPTRSMKHGPDFRGTVDNIYRLNPVGKKDPLAKDHGAVFPVQFAEYFVSNFSDESVLDLFGGSGTTMIAAEKLGRKAFLMEFEPRYVDTIIARWERYTGQKASRIDG